MADIRYTGVNPVVTKQAMEIWQNDKLFTAVRDVPLLRVSVPAGQLAILDQDMINRDDVAQRSSQHTEAEKSSLGFKFVTYTTDQRALEFDVSAQIEAQIKAEIGTDLALTVPRALAQKANVHTEGRFSALWTSASWFRTVTGNAADSGAEGTTAMNRVFWTDTTKDPVPGIRAEKRIFLLRTGRLPTNFRLGFKAFEALASNPFVRAQVAMMVAGGNITVAQTMIATEAQMSMLLGLKVTVAGGIKNTAKEQATAVNAFIINPLDALMTFDGDGGDYSATPSNDGSPPVINLAMPTGFARVAFVGVAPDGFAVRSFPRPEIGAGGSQAYILDLYQGFVIVDNRFGTYYTGISQ